MGQFYPDAFETQDIVIDGCGYRIPFYRDCKEHGVYAMEYQMTAGMYAFYWCGYCNEELQMDISPYEVKD